METAYLAPALISKALGIVKSDSRSKEECDLGGMSGLGPILYYIPYLV